MHKFRTILSVVATAAMVLGTMGVAAAAGTSSNETRAAFIQQLDESLNISPVYPATPDYQDVPSTSPYYGYIEAATQKGFVNGISKGMFGPNLPITRAEAAKVLVEAYGAGAQATATSTKFTDNASIPTALVGFVAEAAQLGLMKGFPDGSVQPEAYLTQPQETHLVAQLKAALASATLKVAASNTDVGVGQIVTLSATSNGNAANATFTVTGTNASSALISGSSFVASASGNYTVQGAVGSATATVTIGVYGAASALKISAPTTVVANGASQTNVTVSVVDANGNVVASNSDNVTIASSNPYAAGVSGSASVAPALANAQVTLAAVNGVATFTLTSGSVPGSATTLTATDGSGTVLNATSYTATVSSTAQTATSLGVSPSSLYMSVNGSGPSTIVDVQVLDQTGNPMLYGTYPFSVSLTGPATFTDGTAGPESYAYNGQGPTVTSNAVVTVEGLQGQTGAITLTASGTSLKSGTGTVTSVISGSATAVQLTAPSSTSFAQGVGSTSGTYGVSIVDAHGYPVSASSTQQVLVTLKDASGNVATDFSLENASGAAINPLNPTTIAADGGIVVNYTAISGGFEITDTSTANADAGAYTVQLSDNSGNGLTASTASSFTLTAGSPYQIAVSGPQFIGAANPTATITAQIEDAAGNAVSVSGAVLTFTPSATLPYSAPTLSAAQVDTNSSGAATVTATVPAYVSTLTAGVNQYTVSATGTYNGTTLVTTNASDGFSVESTVATGVSVDLLNTGTTYTNATSLAQAGEPVVMTVYANDQYGNQVNTNDTIALTFGGTGSFVTGNATSTSAGTPTAVGTAPGAPGLTTTTSYDVTLTNGKAVLDFYAYGAGTVTITGADSSTAANVSGTADMSVLAQPTVSTFALYDQSGNNASTEAVTAGTPVTLTLKGTDALGNLTFPTVAYAVYLGTTSSTGSFRLSTTGADVQTVVLPAGSSGVTVYYLDGTSNSPAFSTGTYVAIGNVTNNSVTLTASGAATGWTASAGVLGTTTSNSQVINFTPNTSGTAAVTVTVGGKLLTFSVNY